MQFHSDNGSWSGAAALVRDIWSRLKEWTLSLFPPGIFADFRARVSNAVRGLIKLITGGDPPDTELAELIAHCIATDDAVVISADMFGRESIAIKNARTR